jgi:tetratricopeptide (TPR) repeat protein
VYLALEEHESALRLLAAAAELAPEEPRWHYLLAAEADVLGRTDLAVSAFEEARRLDPSYDTTFARLGSIFLDRGELERAESAYASYRDRRPDESLGYVGLARVALARGDVTRAEDLLRTAVEQTPNDFMAHRFLARALAESGRGEEARRAARVSDRLPRYSGWLSVDRHLQEAHALANTRRHLANRMRAAVSVQDWTAFVSAAEALLERFPDDVDTAKNLALVFFAMGRVEDAERLTDRALQTDPESAEAYCLRARIAFQRRDFAAVQGALDAAERIDASLACIHDVRGRSLYLQGRVDEAIRSTERALELDPGDSTIRLTLAEMCYRDGRRGRALGLIREVQRDDPGNPVAQRLLEVIGGDQGSE